MEKIVLAQLGQVVKGQVGAWTGFAHGKHNAFLLAGDVASGPRDGTPAWDETPRESCVSNGKCDKAVTAEDS